MIDSIVQEKRKMIELALEAGRKRQNSQTGLVHVCYESESSQHDTIPLFENACFALALFRSRLSENVLEGKAILEKILSFQVEGNFPIYLHEYPICKNRNLVFHILPVLFYIQKEFATVLGEALTQKLQRALSSIFVYAEELEKQDLLSKGVFAKYRAAQQKEDFLSWTPASSSEWGDFLIALQMLYFAKPIPKSLLEKVCSYWDRDVLAYVGKDKISFQEKREPAVFLYEFFMGALFQTYPSRLLQDSSLAIQASLVYPFSEEFFLEKPGKKFVASPLEEIPNRILWGEEGFLHSLVWEGKNLEVETAIHEEGFDLIFTLPSTVPQEEDDHTEISLYWNLHERNSFSLEKRKGTVFSLDDTVYLHSFPINWKVSFSVGGEGRYLGHFSRGNRSSQRATKGANRFEAYDYRMSIRTVERSEAEKMKISFRFF